VYCSISGYGPSGPWSSLPGYDVVIAGTHGLMSITGSPDAPAKVGVAMTDIVTGTFAHGAILTALYDRAAHPEKLGQRVDCKYRHCKVHMCMHAVWFLHDDNANFMCSFK
jgi:succinate--hydroxymethylglutarate CoA-transferase